jgi:type II secretory pathway pseudopilin PulG
MSPLASGKTCRRLSSRQHGSSLFELLIAASVISVIALLLLDRLLSYQAYAERTAMEVTVVNMRSGLRLQVAELMTQDRLNEVGKLVNENPVRWLETPPPNYLGELAHPLPKTLEQGYWYFDTTTRELVYLPHDNRFFMAPWRDRKEAMRFQVISMRKAPGKEGQSESNIEWVTLTHATH